MMCTVKGYVYSAINKKEMSLSNLESSSFYDSLRVENREEEWGTSYFYNVTLPFNAYCTLAIYIGFLSLRPLRVHNIKKKSKKRISSAIPLWWPTLRRFYSEFTNNRARWIKQGKVKASGEQKSERPLL